MQKSQYVRVLGVWGTMILLLATTQQAAAAGMEYPDNGTIAIGRGGAHAANPEDGLAFQYNPAGLAQQLGLRLHLDSRLAWQDTRFTPASGEAPIANSEKPFLAPAGAISYGFGAVGPLSALTVAVGATGPSAIGKSRYPVDGVQRYALDSTDYFIAYYSAALAGEWTRGDFSARLGLTAQLVQGTARFDQAVWSAPGSYKQVPADRNGDSQATFNGTSGLIPTFVVGLSISPTRDVDIGLSYRPRIDFDAPGTLDIELAKAASNIGATVEGNTARLQLTLAGVMRAGVAWRPKPGWRVELDGVWEQWSALQQIRVLTSNINVVGGLDPSKSTPVKDVIFEKHMRDAFSVRLGGDHDLLPKRLTVRAGFIFETSAIEKDYASVDFPNWQREVVSAGASVSLWGAWLDLAYAHHFVESQHVTNSQVVQQVGPTLPLLPASNSAVVGNGVYDSQLDIVSISLRVPFGELRSSF